MPPMKGRKADTEMIATTGSRPNTIGLARQDLGTLMDKLDERGGGHQGAIKRTFARWPFRHNSLKLVLEHPGGSKAVFQVPCRNLSRGGIGVLHNAYVHTGTGCVLHMPRLDGADTPLASTIVRCTHMGGMVHELGIEFNDTIQISDYVELDPLMGWSSFERVDPQKLVGSLLVVTESELDERIIGHFLGDTQLKMRSVKTPAEAESLDPGSIDAAIIDLAVSGAKQLFTTIREKGIANAMIAIGPDACTATRTMLQEIEADGFVFKPLSSERLLSVLADCMLGGDAIHIDPALAGESSSALVKSCIEQLQAAAAEIRKAIVEDDPMQCYAICQHIKAIAMPIGLRPIAALADTAATNVAQSMSVSESGVKLQEIARACERIRISSSTTEGG